MLLDFLLSFLRPHGIIVVIRLDGAREVHLDPLLLGITCCFHQLEGPEGQVLGGHPGTEDPAETAVVELEAVEVGSGHGGWLELNDVGSGN